MSAAYVTVTALYMLVPSLVAPIMVSAEADVSPNTSAVDLLAFPRTRQASQSSSTTQRIPWHPKLTLYRLLIVSLTVGLAIAKSATSYLNLTFASITLEWILGIVVFLLLHFIGSYEVHEPRVLPWFFHDDYLEYLWSFIRTFTRFQPPAYLSDERKVGMILTGKHPPITGYRILVTVMALSFGLLKATLSFVGLNMGATTVECIFGVGIVTCLYWLGLYEAGPPGTFVFLFHVDYAPNISYVLHNRKVIFISFLRIIGVLLCSRLSWTFYDAIPMVHAMDYSSDYPIVEQSRRLMFTGVMTYLFVNCTLLVGMLLKSLWEPFHASPIGMQFMRRSGLERIVSVYDEYLVASSSSHSRGQYFYIKRVLLRQFVKLPLNIYIVITHLIILTICAWFAIYNVGALISNMGIHWTITSFLIVRVFSFALPGALGVVLVFLSILARLVEVVREIRRDYSTDTDQVDSEEDV